MCVVWMRTRCVDGVKGPPLHLVLFVARVKRTFKQSGLEMMDCSKFCHLVHEAIGKVCLLQIVEMQVLVRVTRLERFRSLMMKRNCFAQVTWLSIMCTGLHFAQSCVVCRKLMENWSQR